MSGVHRWRTMKGRQPILVVLTMDVCTVLGMLGEVERYEHARVGYSVLEGLSDGKLRSGFVEDLVDILDTSQHGRCICTMEISVGC